MEEGFEILNPRSYEQQLIHFNHMKYRYYILFLLDLGDKQQAEVYLELNICIYEN